MGIENAQNYIDGGSKGTCAPVALDSALTYLEIPVDVSDEYYRRAEGRGASLILELRRAGWEAGWQSVSKFEGLYRGSDHFLNPGKLRRRLRSEGNLSDDDLVYLQKSALAVAKKDRERPEVCRWMETQLALRLARQSGKIVFVQWSGYRLDRLGVRSGHVTFLSLGESRQQPSDRLHIWSYSLPRQPFTIIDGPLEGGDLARVLPEIFLTEKINVKLDDVDFLFAGPPV